MRMFVEIPPRGPQTTVWSPKIHFL